MDIITPRFRINKDKANSTVNKSEGLSDLENRELFTFYSNKGLKDYMPYIIGVAVLFPIMLLIINVIINQTNFTFDEKEKAKQNYSFMKEDSELAINNIDNTEKTKDAVADANKPLVNENFKINNFGLESKSFFLQPNSILTTSLEEEISDTDGINKAVIAMRDVIDLRYLKPKQKIDFTYLPANDITTEKLQSLVISLSNIEKAVAFINSDGTFTAVKQEKNIDIEPIFKEAVVESSFYQAGIDVGISEKLMMEMFDIFAFSVDFQRDVNVGDKFAIVYEKLLDSEGNDVGVGRPLAAQIKTGDSVYKTFAFLDDTGETNFYDDKGKGVRKALLLMPVSGGRLTSGYVNRRNPLYGYSEFHPALDFAAPTGTPIMSAGDGYVKFRGWMPKGYGNYVIVAHSNGFETLYGHMSRFARSAPVGSRVKQGTIIGYVGSTGMSTGPHVHYEVRQGRQRYNPATIVRKMNSGRNLTNEERERFFEEIKPMMDQFESSLKYPQKIESTKNI